MSRKDSYSFLISHILFRSKKAKYYCFSFVVLFLASSTAIIAQTDSLLQNIADRQQTQTDFFYQGSFPSYRIYGRGRELKPDNNIFFTGLIAFTLKQLQPLLDKKEQVLCDSIIQRTQSAYPHFRNKSGSPTYNFWRTDPPLVFPNSWFLTKFNKSNSLPDDLDDSAIILLSQNPSDSIQALVKKMMSAHANGKFNQVKNIFLKYRQLPIYSTWFGVKMPVDFDFCVLCNVLYFVKYFQLPLNINDSATITFLKEMITNRYYITHPSYIAPHYGRTPLLIYHISRLLYHFSIPVLDRLKPELLRTAYREYYIADNWLDSVILSTSIIWLNGKNLPVSPPNEVNLMAAHKTFFVASFAEMLPDFWKKLLLSSQWIKYYFICPAYRQTLYLENQVMSQRIIN